MGRSIDPLFGVQKLIHGAYRQFPTESGRRSIDLAVDLRPKWALIPARVGQAKPEMGDPTGLRLILSQPEADPGLIGGQCGRRSRWGFGSGRDGAESRGKFPPLRDHHVEGRLGRGNPLPSEPL